MILGPRERELSGVNCTEGCVIVGVSKDTQRSRRDGGGEGMEESWSLSNLLHSLQHLPGVSDAGADVAVLPGNIHEPRPQVLVPLKFHGSLVGGWKGG